MTKRIWNPNGPRQNTRCTQKDKMAGRTRAKQDGLRLGTVPGPCRPYCQARANRTSSPWLFSSSSCTDPGWQRSLTNSRSGHRMLSSYEKIGPTCEVLGVRLWKNSTKQSGVGHCRNRYRWGARASSVGVGTCLRRGPESARAGQSRRE